MEIKSNTSGKLKKMINGTVFSNEFIFVRELFQNSQRAKASLVTIKSDDKQIVFTDNGRGCKNPKSLFTLDYSDWESTDEGFGIGFWSCLALKKLISVKVESHNWECELFVDKILDGDLSLDIKYKVSSIEGFVVTLNIKPLDFEEESELYEEIVNVAQYLDFCTYHNGREIPKIDIFASVYGEFIRDTKNRVFNGRLSITDNPHNSINVFYEKRFVCSIYNNGYIKGVIELKKGSANLKEPDRRELIYDDKYYILKDTIAKEAKKIYIEFIKSNPSKDTLNEFSDAVDYHLDVKDYEKYMNYDFFFDTMSKEKNQKKDSKDNLKQNTSYENEDIDEVAISKDSDESNSYVDSSENNIDDSSSNTSDLSCNEGVVDDEYSNDDFYMDDYTVECQVSKKPNITSFDFVKSQNNDLNKAKDFKTLIRKSNKIVWLLKEEVDNYADEIAQAEYAGLTVIKVDNILYANVFEKYNKLHISDFYDSFRKTYSFKNIEVRNLKEERFLRLLKPICALFSLPLNTFVIANIEQSLILEHNGKVLYKEKMKNKKDNIHVYAVTGNGTIFLDRTALNLSRFNLSKTGTLGVQDLKAIMSSINTISHELAHLLYGTNDNTVSHYKTEVSISAKITDLYTN